MTLQKLREALLECFDLRYQSLHSLFVDGRISPWRDGLPQTDNNLAQSQALIAYLSNQTRVDTGENGLKLFLQVLSEQFDPLDSCHQRFKSFAEMLDSPLESPPIKVKAITASKQRLSPQKKRRLLNYCWLAG